ncbi:hypothetical protein GO495_25850 [Chitinophaga oryziterrae]|uniref:Copper resistance protein NlpE n=1 Tax=Chitinophaga oryziterrae TaxID=1031224 RepID=A0A6N8JGF9_9BACT|nr:hypothetical protein [Chitinophaga oryziterrae]MVT44044.1 hypothetical protein [Chitinophaga oryziterrae]
MRLFSLFAGLLTMIVSSCQQPDKKTATAPTDSTQTVNIIHPGPQCFTQIMGKDTAYLEFETDNEVVTGQLEYKPFEKDKNKGTISGTIMDNIIEVDYHYMSEGIMSVRKAIFKLNDDNIFEAKATKQDKDGQPLFDQDYSKLQFDSIPFVKGNCR